MKKTVYVCDHCGAEIKPIKDYTDLELDDFGSIKKVDLCDFCFKELCNIGVQIIVVF